MENADSQMQSKKGSVPTYRQIASFFLPLSATSLIMSLSNSIVNAGVARTPEPEVSLAAYALARSLVRIIENPMFMVRQTVVSLVSDVVSFAQVRRFMYVLAGAITVVIATLGFTPLGFILFRNIIGASPEVARQSHIALAVLAILPLTTVCRNVYHGAAILSRQTILVPKTSFIRLIIMSVSIFGFASFTEWPGALSASLSFGIAFIVEAAVMRWRAKPLLAKGDAFSTKPGGIQLSNRGILAFFFPLIATTFMATAFGPIINIGLARTVRPEIALAAYAVGHSLSRLFIAPLNMLHQCSLAFIEPSKPETVRIVRGFMIRFVALTCGFVVFLSFSPLGSWVLRTLMGVSDDVGRSALSVLRVMSLMPVVLGWREYLWGIFMQQRRTRLIGNGKTINLVVLVFVLVGLLLKSEIDPATAGAWAMVIGELGECIYMQAFFYKTVGKSLSVSSS